MLGVISRCVSVLRFFDLCAILDMGHSSPSKEAILTLGKFGKSHEDEVEVVLQRADDPGPDGYRSRSNRVPLACLIGP